MGDVAGIGGRAPPAFDSFAGRLTAEAMETVNALRRISVLLGSIEQRPIQAEAHREFFWRLAALRVSAAALEREAEAFAERAVVPDSGL